MRFFGKGRCLYCLNLKTATEPKRIKILVVRQLFVKIFINIKQIPSVYIFIIFACIFTKYEDDILTMEKRKFIRHCIYLFTSLILYAVEFILLIRLTYIGFISHLLK